MNETKLQTIGEMKKALKAVKAVYVWVALDKNNGEYFEITKRSLLRGLHADIPFHRDGAHDATEFHGTVRGDELYVN